LNKPERSRRNEPSLHPLTDPDVSAAARLLTVAYPHRSDEPASWSRWPDAPDRWRWLFKSPDGVVHAYLALWRVQEAGFRLDLIVDPAHRRRGIGSSLLELLTTRARVAGARSLQARPYAEDAHAMRLLEARGFRETMRMIGLELDDVASVSLEPFARLDSKLAARSIRVTTLADELRASESSWQKLRDTNYAAQIGWPDPDPPLDGTPHPPESVERFRSRAYEFGMVPEACFLAVLGLDYIGYSALSVNDDSRTRAGSGGTGVRPEHRGIGIATALKARCIAWAQANGVGRLATSSGNPAMVRVNEKFGFRRTYVEVRLVKRLDETVR
jgi:GNAT superfamily N-acetyltransferase